VPVADQLRTNTRFLQAAARLLQSLRLDIESPHLTAAHTLRQQQRIMAVARRTVECGITVFQTASKQMVGKRQNIFQIHTFDCLIQK